jgi:hypothetical protein
MEPSDVGVRQEVIRLHFDFRYTCGHYQIVKGAYHVKRDMQAGWLMSTTTLERHDRAITNQKP